MPLVKTSVANSPPSALSMGLPQLNLFFFGKDAAGAKRTGPSV